MRVIVVVGGVISGVGKGIATASIGKILQSHGYSVTAVKIDPYINFDAGTLRPTEHGEVWVTDDGGEIDQDLGNYERFLSVDIPKKNNITTGQIYWKIIHEERRGKFLGQTVQFIPHVPDEIKRRIKNAAKKHDGSEYDFVIVEIGGTIGDYENVPFLFAMKSLEIELGRNNFACVLVSYLPIPSNVGEMKTKPTQQAIKMLNESGIFPDFVFCRAPQPLDLVRKKKIEVYANIDIDNIISAPDIKTIYRVPTNFEKEGLGKKILKRFSLEPKTIPDWSHWSTLVDRIENPSRRIKIAMIGKYVDIGDFSLSDSYISINQALEHAGANLDVGVDISWVDAKKFESDPAAVKHIENYNGIIVPGGFGSSGVEGKIAAIKFARENNVPFLGLCYGMQLAVIEYARSICGLHAHTTEVDPATKAPVVDILPMQRAVLEKSRYGGTMRLGAYAAMLDASRVLKIYKETGRMERDMERIQFMPEERLGKINGNRDIVLERHRHRYEVNPEYIEMLANNGLIFSGHHIRLDGTNLMEFIELPKHVFFIATQAHPEFKSRLEDPAPLFLEFLRSSAE
ncbi:MAG: CTP synthase [Candidatus Aenigmarchaeota archaeon]|nr:CTP synthase [Candidatus Aenigmarchaeota archaeon]